MTGLNLAGRTFVPPIPFVPYEKDLDQLWYAPFDGATSPVMVVDKASAIRVADPVASPDYSQIAYAYFDGGDPVLWVVDSDGSDDTDLVEQCLYPAWHPSGNHILFCSYDTYTLIRRIDPDGTNLTTVYDSGSTQLNRAIYNSTGTLIAFFDEDAEEVWVVEADGSNPTKVGDLAQGYVEENAVSWQNNADVVVFGDGAASGGDLIQVNADGTGSVVLTTMTGSDDAWVSKFAWTPDDSAVFFLSFDNPGGHYTLWQVPEGGGTATQVTPEFGVVRPPSLVLGGRIWADGEDVPFTGIQGLISALPDGSDQRIDDGGAAIRLEFPF